MERLPLQGHNVFGQDASAGDRLVTLRRSRARSHVALLWTVASSVVSPGMCRGTPVSARQTYCSGCFQPDGTARPGRLCFSGDDGNCGRTERGQRRCIGGVSPRAARGIRIQLQRASTATGDPGGSVIRNRCGSPLLCGIRIADQSLRTSSPVLSCRSITAAPPFAGLESFYGNNPDPALIGSQRIDIYFPNK